MSLKYALLTLLTGDRLLSGYDLLHYFDGSVGFVWHATHPQVYRELDKLRREGLVANELVVQSGRPNKKVYSITEQGMHELLAWVATPTQLQLMKDGLLVRAFSYGRIDLDIAVARLAEHRTLHEERLVRYRELMKLVEGSSDAAFRTGYQLVLQCGIMHQETYLRWCDWATRFLRRSRRGRDRGKAIVGPKAQRSRPSRHGARRPSR
jgi:DNA-binding PadR family transcriptional regulator